MLTNYDLEDLCEHYRIPLLGIYMKDQLPNRVQNGNYIINLDSSNGGKNKGTHWTALVINNKDALFFDPFGATPSIEIRQFVKGRKDSHLGFNNWVIQDLKSENCGYFCLSFLMNIQPSHLYKTANNYINQYEDNTKNNDDILRRQFISSSSPPPPLIQRLFTIR